MYKQVVGKIITYLKKAPLPGGWGGFYYFYPSLYRLNPKSLLTGDIGRQQDQHKILSVHWNWHMK